MKIKLEDFTEELFNGEDFIKNILDKNENINDDLLNVNYCCKNDYLYGKIYKITCNTSGLVYIGSTTKSLEERLQKHIYDYRRFIISDKKKFISSIFIIYLQNYKIELLENYPCLTKIELETREKYYINTTDCVNEKFNKSLHWDIEKYSDNLRNFIKAVCYCRLQRK
jgi:hypothetical protein